MPHCGKPKDTKVVNLREATTALKLTEATVWDPTERWTTLDAGELYDVASWGKGYFSVGQNGHLLVHPEKEPNRTIDLKELVEKLECEAFPCPY